MTRIVGRSLLGVALTVSGLTATGAAQMVRPGITPAPRSGGPVPAAHPAATAARGETVRLRRLPRLKGGALVRTPEYQTGISRSNRRAREWAVLDVEYDTAPEWLDELTFTYYVMAEARTADAKKAYSFYKLTVRYIDIARGDHASGVVLPPNAVLRYGEPVALAVEVAGADGKVLAMDSVMTGNALPADWWKNDKVLGSESVVKREGYLVERSKTPFAFVNSDDYEAVK